MENWDDYQLRSIQIGGNKKLFEILKEYDLDTNESSSAVIKKKYKHEAVQWYRKRHMWQMDGGKVENYTVNKPAKNFKEKLERTKKGISEISKSERVKNLGSKAKTWGQSLATKIRISNDQLGDRIQAVVEGDDAPQEESDADALIQIQTMNRLFNEAKDASKKQTETLKFSPKDANNLTLWTGTLTG